MSAPTKYTVLFASLNVILLEDEDGVNYEFIPEDDDLRDEIVRAYKQCGIFTLIAEREKGEYVN